MHQNKFLCGGKRFWVFSIMKLNLQKEIQTLSLMLWHENFSKTGTMPPHKMIDKGKRILLEPVSEKNWTYKHSPKKKTMDLSYKKKVLKEEKTRHPKISSISGSYHESNVKIVKSFQTKFFKARVGRIFQNLSSQEIPLFSGNFKI